MKCSIRVMTAFIVWSIAGVGGGALYLFATPRLEALLAPVLVDQRVEIEPGDRTPGRMCWTWYWTKVRHAQPVVVAWSITVEGTAVEFPAIVQRERNGDVVRNPQTAALGPGRNDLCVTIPAEIDKVPGLTIRGQINYRVPHGGWTIWQDLPVVRVPPL